MLSKSLIQFSFDGHVCGPSLLSDLKPNYSGGNEDNGNLLQKAPCTHCYTQCPNPAAGHHRPTPPLETPGHPQASPGQSPVGSLLLSPATLCTRFCCALQETISQSCVSSSSSMVGLMVTSSKRAYAIPKSASPSHTHVCFTQSPCPCDSPLLTYTSTGDTQTQFCLSLGLWILVCTRFV